MVRERNETERGGEEHGEEEGNMLSLEILSLNMDRMMRRITASSKEDSMLEKLNNESILEIKRVREWIDSNANSGRHDRKSLLR